MNDVSKANVRFLRDEIFALSQQQLAHMLGVSKGLVGQWETMPSRDVNITLVSYRLGVNASWLIGQSKAMWSDAIVDMPTALRQALPTINAQTPSERFREVVAWLQAFNSSMFCDMYLAGIVRVAKDDVETGKKAKGKKDTWKSLETWYSCKNGPGVVGTPIIAKLADFVDIPLDWFVTGDASLANDPGDDFAAVVERAKRLGVKAGDVAKYLDAVESTTMFR